MRTSIDRKQSFIALANELVIDGWSYVSAICAVAQLSPLYATVIDNNAHSVAASEIYQELKRRQPQAADRHPEACG